MPDSFERPKVPEAQRVVMKRAWNGVRQFWADMWQENKPGFFILSILIVAMFWSIGYFVYSKTTGVFVVTVEKISKEDELDLNVKNILKVYCREFVRECTERGKEQIEKDIRLVLHRILMPVKTLDAKITYTNNTRHSIAINRFLHRTAPGPWQVSDTQNRFRPKIERLRSSIGRMKGNVPFETKVDYADTLALTENHGSFTILPGETKVWRLGYNERTEIQIEYRQNGKFYRTPVLRPR